MMLETLVYAIVFETDGLILILSQFALLTAIAWVALHVPLQSVLFLLSCSVTSLILRFFNAQLFSLYLFSVFLNMLLSNVISLIANPFSVVLMFPGLLSQA